MDDHTLNHVMAAADLLGIPITRQMLEQILYAHAFAVRIIETGRPLDAELTAGFASAPRCELGHILDGNGLCWTCSASSAGTHASGNERSSARSERRAAIKRP